MISGNIIVILIDNMLTMTTEYDVIQVSTKFSRSVHMCTLCFFYKTLQ